MQPTPPSTDREALIQTVGELRDEIAVLNANLEAERKKSERERRRLFWTRVGLALTVISLCFDLTITFFLKGNIDKTNKTQQSQYTSCTQTNTGRTTLRLFFDGIWDQNLSELKANPTHQPPAEVAKDVQLVRGYITKTNQSFASADCSKLPH